MEMEKQNYGQETRQKKQFAICRLDFPSACAIPFAQYQLGRWIFADPSFWIIEFSQFPMQKIDHEGKQLFTEALQCTADFKDFNPH